MKKDDRNFALNEIKKEKKSELNSKSEYLFILLEVCVKSIPIFMLAMAIYWSAQGIKLCLNKYAEIQDNSVVETNDSPQSKDDWVNDFLIDYIIFNNCD